MEIKDDRTPEDRAMLYAELPEGFFLGKNDRTRKLYDREEKLSEWIERCVEEWEKILADIDRPNERYKHAYPEALFSVLDQNDTNAACAAAIAFLNRKGFAVMPVSRYPVTKHDSYYPNRFGKPDLVFGPESRERLAQNLSAIGEELLREMPVEFSIASAAEAAPAKA